MGQNLSILQISVKDVFHKCALAMELKSYIQYAIRFFSPWNSFVKHCACHLLIAVYRLVIIYQLLPRHRLSSLRQQHSAKVYFFCYQQRQWLLVHIVLHPALLPSTSGSSADNLLFCSRPPRAVSGEDEELLPRSWSEVPYTASA